MRITLRSFSLSWNVQIFAAYVLAKIEALCCFSNITRNRRHMVDNESKSNLRAAVVDALSDYSRTCDKSDVDSMQV